MSIPTSIVTQKAVKLTEVMMEYQIVTNKINNLIKCSKINKTIENIYIYIKPTSTDFNTSDKQRFVTIKNLSYSVEYIYILRTVRAK